MDSSKELVAIQKVPILDKGTYGHWKMKMSMMIKAIGDDAWAAVEEGWTAPTVKDGDGNDIPKPRIQWTTRDKEASKYNAKALYAIFNAVSENQFQMIQCCTSAKDAWDRLESTYEGTNNVKTMRLDMLASRFEMLKMEESETIEEFSSKLSGIAMEAQVLGKKYKDKKLVKKLLRCLPSRFESKKTAMATALDTNNMAFDVAVGHLLTYELELKGSAGTSQTTFLSEDRKKLQEMEEEMALMAKKFKKWERREQQSNKGGSGRNESKDRNSEKSKKEEARCHECHGIGHFKANCATAQKKELKCGICKGFGHTSSECTNNMSNQKSYIGYTESESDNSDEDDVSTGFVAFPAVIEGDSETSSESESDMEIEKPTLAEDKSDLYESWMSLGKEKLILMKDKIELIEQNEQLKELLHKEQEKSKTVNNLLEQNKSLIEQLRSEQSKNSLLKSELAETIKKVKMLNSGTKDLNKILTVGRTSNSAYGLGYDGTNGKKQMKFVKASLGHKEETLVKPLNNSEGRHKEQNNGSCYFCGKYGHFKRTCYHYQKKIQKLLREGRYYANRNSKYQVWIRREDLYGAATHVTDNTKAKCGNNCYLQEQKEVNLKAKSKTNDEGNVVRIMHSLRTHEL